MDMEKGGVGIPKNISFSFYRTSFLFFVPVGVSSDDL